MDEREAYSISMNAQPRDLLELNHAGRLVPPAGLRKQRGVSSLEMGYSSFGTANGRLMSEMPNTARIRESYHYEPAESTSPTSSIMSPKDFPDNPESPGQGKGSTFVRPSWQKINADYRTNWNVTRDRYNLSGKADANPHVSFLQQPHVSAPIQPGGPDKLSAESLNRSFPGQSPAAAAAGQMLAEMQKEASTAKKQARDQRPSWSNISTGYKHDWGTTRERYDLQRFNDGQGSPDGSKILTEALDKSWLQQRGGAGRDKTNLIVSSSNLVSYPKPFGLTQVGPGMYAVSHPSGSSF